MGLSLNPISLCFYFDIEVHVLIRLFLPLVIVLFFVGVASSLRAADSETDTIDEAAHDPGEISKEQWLAWRKAEQTLGDSEEAGRLAFEFGEGYHPWSQIRASLAEDAFDRSIELARLSANPNYTEMERRVAALAFEVNRPFTEYRNGRVRVKRVRGASDISPTYKRLKELGLEKSELVGRLLAIKARAHCLRDEWDDCADQAQKAISVSEKVGADLGHKVLQEARFDLGRAYIERRQYAPAYQAFMEALDIAMAPNPQTDDAILRYGPAVSNALAAERNLKRDKKWDRAKAAGWQPLDGSRFPTSGDVFAIVRVPPIMPPRAKRSGWVDLRYDVGRDGRPSNIRVVDSTESIFEKYAIEAVEQWFFATGGHTETRKDVESVMNFRLSNTSGVIIPSPRPHPNE